MLARVDTIASASLSALPACPDKHFSACLKSLSILPRQQSDDTKGELMTRLYQRKLGHLPAAAMSYLADRALERCRWFPTIAECLEIVAEWTRDDDAVRAKRRAVYLAREERHARMQDLRRGLRLGELDQGVIDTLDERTKRILECETLLFRCDCGSYTARPPRVPAVELPADLPGVLERLSERFPSRRQEQPA